MLEPNRCGRAHDLVREAARPPDAQGRVGERPAQPVGRDARGVAADRQQRDEVPDRPVEVRAARRRGAARTTRAAADRAHVSTGERRVGEQQQVGELVVEPIAAERAEQHDLRRAGRQGGLHGQLGVGRLLVGRVALDPDAGIGQPAGERAARPSRGRRSAGRAPAEPIERGGAAVGGDDQVGAVEPRHVGSRRARRTPRPRPSSASTLHRVRKRRTARSESRLRGRAAARAASTSFAGMTRIRFEGLRTHRRPHSQRCRAPLSFLELSDSA